VRILIAPDKFRHALDAARVAAALAAGARAARPEAELVLCPLGDGGEGTGRILANVLGAAPRQTLVLDPLARPHAATWWWHEEQRLAIIEMAQASGLALLADDERDPLRTTSFGTGQLLRAAADAGASHALLCVGGSATVDGGTGCLQALGCRLLDDSGRVLPEPAGGATLPRIARVQPGPPLPMTIDVLCDVENPLLGPRGAAAVFGPQKGADRLTVRKLAEGLAHWAEIVGPVGEGDLAARRGTGAAGGLPFALVALCRARLCSGFDAVAEHVRLDDQLAGCNLCLTGEGRIDDQTASGKVVAGVARRAARYQIPTWAFCGQVRCGPGRTLADLAQSIGAEQIIVITPANTPLARALAETEANLRRASEAALTTRK